MTRMIRSIVETGLHPDEEFYELPDDWDSLSEKTQEAILEDIAVTHQNNVAPCGAWVVEVDD